MIFSIFVNTKIENIKDLALFYFQLFRNNRQARDQQA